APADALRRGPTTRRRLPRRLHEDGPEPVQSRSASSGRLSGAPTIRSPGAPTIRSPGAPTIRSPGARTIYLSDLPLWSTSLVDRGPRTNSAVLDVPAAGPRCYALPLPGQERLESEGP